MTAFPPAGAFPVGSPPSPSAVVAARAPFLADAIDPSSGEYRSIARGVDPTEAAAFEALRIRYGSGSAVRDTGNRLHEIEKVDDSTEALVKAEVAFAWKRLIADRKIELKSVKVVEDGDTVSVWVLFRNLVTGNNEGKFELPLLELIGAAS